MLPRGLALLLSLSAWLLSTWSEKVLAQPPTLQVNVSITPATCQDVKGLIVVSVTGGTAPYSYSFDGSPAQYSGILSVSAGTTHYIDVTDATGTKVSTTAILPPGDQPTLGVAQATQLSHCGYADGTVAVEAGGGVPPYSFSLDKTHWQPSGMFNNLYAGNYLIWVRDAKGCFQYATSTINDCLDLSFSNGNSICGSGGVINVNAGNLHPPYTYSLDGATWKSSGVFTNLAPGNYLLRIKDGTGFLYYFNTVILDQCGIEIVAQDVSATCSQTDGQINATVNGGAPPYQYTIDGIHFQDNGVFMGLPAGRYTVMVVDAAGNRELANTKVDLNCSAVLTATTPATISTCGKGNAAITVTVTGGKAPYHYSLDGINFQDSNVFPGVAPGAYQVTVKDGAGAVSIIHTTIRTTTAPGIGVRLGVASCNNNDGSVEVSGSAGLAPYQYSLDGGHFVSSGIFGNQSAGYHLAAVEDANGCIVSLPITIPLTNTVTAAGGADIPICEGRSGRIMATSNGASFSWQPTTGLDDSTILMPRASPHTSITYTLTARTGACQAVATVNVLVSPAPVAAAAAVLPVCPGQSTQLQGSGGEAYSWSPSLYLSDTSIAAPRVNRPAQSITYRLSVTDATGCTSLQPATVTVTVTPPPKVFIGDDTSLLAGQPLPLHVTDINNTGFDSWKWDPPLGLDNVHGQDPVAHPEASVVYTVVASTGSGCTARAHIAIRVFSVADIFVPNAFTPNGDGHNDVLRALPVGIREFRYFAVWSRWGQRIFYTTNPSIGWDGTINGRRGEAGVFVWKAGGTDYKGDPVQREGTVFLIR